MIWSAIVERKRNARPSNGLGRASSSKSTQIVPKIALALILFASAIGLLPHVDLRCRPGDRNTITGAYLCAANTSAHGYSR